ncbi:MAG: hypothetical protein Q9163_001538 [Psora crenata]
MASPSTEADEALARAMGILNVNEEMPKEEQRDDEQGESPKIDAGRKFKDSTSTPTLYPKIFKLSDFLYTAKEHYGPSCTDTTIRLGGSVKLHGTHADIVAWVEDWKYADICDEGARIYHVGKAGFVSHDIYLSNVKASEVKIKEMVDQVEKECPFAKMLGAASGGGEGIVWKATDHCSDPAFWFMSQSDLFAISNSSKLPASALDMENRERIETFAKAIVTEARLEQGWDHLSQKDAGSLGWFMNWILADCLTEEKRDIEELKIPKGKLSQAVGTIAKPWFWDKLRAED